MSAKREWRAADARAALRKVPILADIDDEQLDQLVGAVDRQHITANQWLFQLGDPSDAIYVVDSGRFAAVGADGEVFREMASGDSIGDLGLIAGETRSAGVRALRDGVVWRIAAETFTEVLANTPQLQLAMLRVMARMLRESRSVNITQNPRVVGILSTGVQGAAPVVDAITTRLQSLGRTAVVAPPAETPLTSLITPNLPKRSAKRSIGPNAAMTGFWWWPTAARVICGADMLSRKAIDWSSWSINPIRPKPSIGPIPRARST